MAKGLYPFCYFLIKPRQNICHVFADHLIFFQTGEPFKGRVYIKKLTVTGNSLVIADDFMAGISH